MPKVTNEIPKISLGGDSLERLRKRLIEMVLQAEDFHSEWEKLQDDYMNSYLCIPQFRNKVDPWPGASNVFLPLTRVVVDGVLAQEYDAMLSNDPFLKVIGFEGSDVSDAEILTRFYAEHVFSKVIPLKPILNDFLFDNALGGTSVLKPRWNRDKTLHRQQVVEEIPRYETVDLGEVLGVPVKDEVLAGVDLRIRELVSVSAHDVPELDNTDPARIYVAPDSGPSLQWPICPWYFQEQYLTWEELIDRRRYGYENIDEELKDKLRMRELTEIERTQRKQDDLGQAETEEKTARVLEFYMRWPLPVSFTDEEEQKEASQKSDSEEAYWEEVIVTFLWDTKKISRVIPLSRVYPDGLRPHIDNRFSRRPRFFYGLGVAAKLRHIQEMTNSAYNQMIDYGTLQNLPFYFYEPIATGLMPESLGLKPGQGYPVQSAGGIQFPRFQGDASFWLSALQQMQIWAERDGGVSDMLLGRNPSTPNAPRTFRGQATALQQANMQFSRMVAMHAEAVVEIFKRVHSLYRKYAPSDMEFTLFSRETGLRQRMRLPRVVLDQDLDFQFILNPNRSAEQQLAQTAMQTMMQIFPLALQSPVLAQPMRILAKQYYEKLGFKNFDEIWPEALVPQLQMGAMMPQQGQGQQGPPGMGMGAPPQLPMFPGGGGMGPLSGGSPVGEITLPTDAEGSIKIQ